MEETGPRPPKLSQSRLTVIPGGRPAHDFRNIWNFSVTAVTTRVSRSCPSSEGGPRGQVYLPGVDFPQYDSPVGLVFVTIALFALGSLVRSAHALPQEISTLTKEQRLDLPYSKENIKVLY